MTDITDDLSQIDDDDPDSGSKLRAFAERQLTEKREMREQMRTMAFRSAGIDPEQGVGKLIATSYQGEITEESILEYAREHGVEPTPPETTSTSDEGEGEEGETSEATADATKVEEGDGKLDEIGGHSTPVEGEEKEQALLSRLESEGKWDEAMAIKADMVNPLVKR